jgi:hypothetical protein
MPGDPTECREHARECERIANTATNEQTRETFQNLAKTWLRLASELEFSKALLNTWSDEASPCPADSRRVSSTTTDAAAGPSS